jgi:hypothetical protein
MDAGDREGAEGWARARDGAARRRRALRRARALLAGLWLAAGCDARWLGSVSPAVVADAGEDVSVRVGESVVLDGSHSQLSALDVWLADGEGPNENRIVLVDSVRGVRVVGPLRTLGNRVFAFPSDLERIGDQVFGVDTYRRQLFQLALEGARVRPIGETSSHRALHALAYDAVGDVLYAVDSNANELLIADRETGSFASAGVSLPGRNTRGLAFDPDARLLYACDHDLHFLYSIDPATRRWGSIVPLPVEGEAHWDELAFHAGQLVGLVRRDDASPPYTQLKRIDPRSGAVTDVGPRLPEVSARSLLVHSLPEPVRWSVENGPDGATIESPGALVTQAAFGRAGRYELRLAIQAGSEPVTDTLTVQVADSAAR